MGDRAGDGLTAQLSGLAPGDHVCWTYESEDQFWAGTASYLAEGAEGGDKLLVFTRSLPPEDAVGRLDAEGLDASALVAAGQLMVAPAEAAYLPDGRWDADRMVEAFAANSDQAVAEGWRALRAAAETAWVLPHLADLDALLAYELRAGRVVASGNLTGLCAYHAGETDPAWIEGLHSVHPVRRHTAPGATGVSFSCSVAASGEIVLEGEVDLFSVEPFTRALELAVAVADGVRVDLSRLRFINVAGLRALASVAGSAGDDRRPVVLHSAAPLFRRCWHLLEYDRLPNVAVA